MEKKERIKKRIDDVLVHKSEILQNAYSKSLENLVEELKIYQHELEFQNDELIRIQNELEVSRNDYRHLFQNAPVGYIVVDEDLRIIEANHAFRRMVSDTIEYKLHYDFRRYLHPSSQDDFHFMCQDIMNTGHSHPINIRLISSEGLHKTMNIYGNIFRKELHHSRLQFTLIDVTEKVVAQTKLAQSEEELRTINNNMTDMIVVSDPSGVISYVSPSCRFLEYTPDEMMGKTVFEMVIPEDRPFVLEKFLHAIATKSSDSIEFRSPKKNGGYVWVETTGDLVLDTLGNIEKAIYVVRDITERKQTEHKLYEIKEMLLQTSRLARVGGWELDIESGKVTWTEVTREIHEVPDDFESTLETGLNFYLEGENRDKLRSVIQEAIENGTPFEEEFQIRTFTGKIRWVKSQGISEFKDGRCVRLYGAFQDIDDKHRADIIIRENEKNLRTLNATKDRFFSIIAHDMKSPFNAILGFSKMLLDEIRDNNTEGIQEYARIIHESSGRAMDLLVNLLDWSRLQMGKFQFTPETFNAAEIIRDIIGLYSSPARAKQIDIQLSVAGEMVVEADLTMFETILRNLLSNAIKFTLKHGRIKISAVRQKQEILFAVSDNGVGIAESDLPKLFSLEENFSRAGTDNEKGTGLGLILCQDFVQMHGGHIWVESEINRGSTFYFSIPDTPGSN